MKTGRAAEFADRIFLVTLIAAVLAFAVATPQLGATARAVPVWVLIATALTLVAALLEDIRARGQDAYRLQRPVPARKKVTEASSQPLMIDALLFLSAPLLVYALGFALGGTAFILTYACFKQRMSVLRTALLGAATCVVLAGLEGLYRNLSG